MRDESEGLWAEHHQEFSAGIDRGIARIMRVFETLTRIQFDAPWDRQDSGTCARP